MLIFGLLVMFCKAYIMKTMCLQEDMILVVR
jgi:hypothetical protein